MNRPVLRVVESAADAVEPLAHLLAVLESASELLRDVGCDVDAQVLDAHRAQLARGREWPGDAVAPVVFTDGTTNATREEVPA